MGQTHNEERIDNILSRNSFNKLTTQKIGNEQQLHSSIALMIPSIRTLAATVDEKLVIRSLRRRLWKAFQNEDVEGAMQLYTATRSQWEEMVCNEIQIAESYAASEREQQLQEKILLEGMLAEEQQKRMQSCSNMSIPGFVRPLKKTLTSSKSTSAINQSTQSGMKIALGDTTQSPSLIKDDPIQSIEMKTLQLMAISSFSSSSRFRFSGKIDVDEAESPRLVSQQIGSHEGMLQQHMNPSEPFVLDDYKSPFDEYPTELTTTNETNSVCADCVGDGAGSVCEESSVAAVTTMKEKSSSFSLFTSRGQHSIRRNRNNASESATANRPLQAFSLRLGRQQRAVISDGEGEVLPLFGTQSLDNSHPIRTLSLGSPITEDDFFYRLANQNQSQQEDAEDSRPAYENQQDLTTPLHESARLGKSDLVRLMLTAGVMHHPVSFDCNIRNGLGRSVLHCVAGGATGSELARCIYLQQQNDIPSIETNMQQPLSSYCIQSPIPLRAAQYVVNDSVDATHNWSETIESTARRQNFAIRKGRGAAKSVARFFRMRNKTCNVVDETIGNLNTDHTETENEYSEIRNHIPPMTEVVYNQIQNDRLETVSMLLSWSHPDDGTCNAGMGLSSNAVDSQNRTALHYAASLGRTDLCLAICDQFGTLLTVVDNSSKTPCELAGRNRWADLAAQLEARAIEYIDPYVTDDDIMYQFGNTYDSRYSQDSINTYHTISPAPPFFWFETYSPDKVKEKREKRISQAFEKLQQSIENLINNKNVRDAIFNAHKREPSLNPIIVDLDEDSATPIMDQINQMIEKSKLEPSDDESDYLEGVPITDISLILSRMKLITTAHVEKYLAFHRWNVSKAIEAFNEIPCEAFIDAKVPLPTIDKSAPEDIHLKFKEVDVSSDCENEEAPTNCLCLICCESFASSSGDWKQLSGCEHGFCKECLGEYLIDSAKSKSKGLVIQCPHHECEALLSHEELKYLSEDLFCQGDKSTKMVLEMLVETSNDLYVATDPSFRFCPIPGCGSAVRFNAPSYAKTSKLAGSGLLELVGAVCTNVCSEKDEVAPNTFPIHPVTYEGVTDMSYYGLDRQPIKAHRFCFQCGEPGIHWPVPCNRLNEWKEVVNEHVTFVSGPDTTRESYNDVAQKLWIKANTKPCPKCDVPIQKDEGCNHMTCRNQSCQYEFCWICRKDWKLHNSETGGFFRCNRWVEEGETGTEINSVQPALPNENEDANDPRTMEVIYGTAMYDTLESRKKANDMNRFLHHFERWNAHIESAALELKMGDSACDRLAPVVTEIIRMSGNEHCFQGKGLSFIHAAFVELLECRSMLQHSYAMSFFRYKPVSTGRFSEFRRRASEQTTFEQFQAELEVMTEQISDVVARSHIRASRSQIMFLTKAAAEKRKEFSNVMINVLFEDMQETKNSLKQSQHGDTERFRPQTLVGGNLDTITGLEGIIRTTGVIDDASSIERAVRRSLQNFLTRSAADTRMLYTDNEEVGGADWTCHVCTFVNSGGRRCNMCATLRSQ